MKIARIYTKTGDRGKSSLADGSRIEKDNIRLESYGTIDELNSIIAICRNICQDNISCYEAFKKLDQWLFAIQNDLFNLGSDLATPIQSRSKNIILLNEEDILQLEKIIDYCQKSLEPLQDFILPGGSILNSYLHLARTVCRRAERCIVSLSKKEEINPSALVYVNRLSDLFFVWSRWVLKIQKGSELIWMPKLGIRNITD